VCVVCVWMYVGYCVYVYVCVRVCGMVWYACTGCMTVHTVWGCGVWGVWGGGCGVYRVCMWCGMHIWCVCCAVACKPVRRAPTWLTTTWLTTTWLTTTLVQWNVLLTILAPGVWQTLCQSLSPCRV